MQQPTFTCHRYQAFHRMLICISIFFFTSTLNAQIDSSSTSPCDNLVTISCGQLYDDTTVGASNDFNAEDYTSCKNYDLVFDFEGPDKVFKVNKSDETTYLSVVMKHDRFTNLTLFVADACTGDEIGCLYKGTNIMRGKDVIGEYFVESDPPLPAGDYYLIVDGFHDEQDGAFWLMATCEPTPCPDQVFILTDGNDDVSFSQPPAELSCGETFKGSTSESENKYTNESYSGCHNFNLDFSYDGPDQIFKVTKEENFGPLNVHLFHGEEINLTLFVFEACGDGTMSCVAKGENLFDGTGKLIGEHYLDDLDPLPKGDYLIVVDGYNEEQHGSFSLTATCGVLDCTGAKELFCGDDMTGETNEDGVNNVSVYLCDGNTRSGYTGKEKVFMFELETEDTIRKITIELTGIEEGQNLDMFLVKEWCSENKCIAESRRSGNSSEKIGPLYLSRGQYYVVVDGFDNATSSFNLSIDSDCQKVTPSICDNGGTYIDLGARISGTLSTDFDNSPMSLKKQQCILDGYSALLWLKDTLYSDSYIYYHEEDGPFEPILTDNSSFFTQVFVFNCSIQSTSDGFYDLTESGFMENDCLIDFENVPAGFYYIVVVSNKADTYTLQMTPDGRCGGDFEVIGLNDMTEDSLVNRENNFFNQLVDNNDDEMTEGIPIDYCGKTSRAYLGNDIVYQFSFEETRSFNIVLSSNDPLGMSLFNTVCAEQCMNFKEIRGSGESIGFFNEILVPGVYYLVIDNNRVSSSGSYSLSISSVSSNNIDQLADSQLCIESDGFHTFEAKHSDLIQNGRLNGAMIDERFNLMFFSVDTSTNLRNRQQTRPIVNSDQVIFDDLFQSIGDPLCGFIPNEDVIIMMQNEEDKSVTRIVPFFDLNDPEGIHINEETYVINGTSRLDSFIADPNEVPITLASATPPFFDIGHQERTITLRLNPNDSFMITLEPSQVLNDWIVVKINNQDTLMGSPGSNIVTLDISENDSTQQRTAFVNLISKSNPFSQRVRITQGIDSVIAQIATPEIIECSGDLVLLDGSLSSVANGVAYNWTSDDGEIFGRTDSISAFAASGGTYQLKVTNDVTSKSDSANVTVVAIDELRVDSSTIIITEEDPGQTGLQGAFEVVVLGGSPPYTQTVVFEDSMVVGGQVIDDTFRIQGLGPGMHRLSIMDMNDCVVIHDFGIPVLNSAQIVGESRQAFKKENQLYSQVPVKIAPNPTRDKIFIEMDVGSEVIKSIHLINSSGQTVSRTTLGLDKLLNYQIDLSEFAKGIYFVQIITDQQFYTERIIFY